MNAILLSLLALSSVAYLFLINTLGTEGFRIRQQEIQIKNLETEHKTLQLRSSNLQSISTIQQAVGPSYVPAANAIYIKDADFALK